MVSAFESRWPFYRSVVLFFGGMAGVGYEAIVQSGERPFLLTVYTVMMGVPIVLGEGKRE